jgi:hydroxymethylbilane synthase
MANRSLRLATRGSPLALRQAELVADALRVISPDLSPEFVVVKTQGDVLIDVALDRIGGQGIFVKEVQAAVLEGRADLAVHSAKDLPSISHPGLALCAVPERGDPRDALVGSTLEGLPAGAAVATGSARRRAQLANLRPDLSFVELRGNMATRIRRASEGSVDAVVVAIAALDRLGWSAQASEILAPTVMLPQVGQGALALECRGDDALTFDLARGIDHAPSHRAVLAERAFLAALDGSCSVPIGAWAVDEGSKLRLSGLIATGDGRVLIRADLTGADPETLGAALAHHLLEDCGGSMIEEWAVTREGAR